MKPIFSIRVLANLILAIGLGLTLGTNAEARTGSTKSPKEALAISQAAIGRAVGDFQFQDRVGKTVKLSDFRGKPLVVNMIYTSCLETCPVITETLLDASEAAFDILGDTAFNVITIGFDAGVDGLKRMAYYAKQRGVSRSNWKFLSGDLADIVGVTDALGFVYFSSAKGFDHLSQVTVLDKDGTVYRQIYGENFEVPQLVEPMKELIFGTLAPYASLDDLVKKIRFFCTIYDPLLGRYRFDYGLFIRIGVGIVFIFFLGVFVVREWRRGGPPTPNRSV
jgi:protein SCO1